MSAVIRLATARDAEPVRAIYAPFCAADSFISFEESAPTVDEMSRRIEKCLANFPWLVCEADGEALGYAYASSHRDRPAYRWSVEVSAYVKKGQRRRGVGRALYTSLFRLLALQGLCNAYAGITLPNEASVGMHESVGFRPVGVYRAVGYKAGAWRDVGWWQRELRPHDPAPALPLGLPAVLNAAGWEEALTAGLS